MTVVLGKVKGGNPVFNPGTGADGGSEPLRMIGGQPVRKITDVSVIRLSGRIRSVTVRPGLFSGSVSMLRYRDGGMLLLDSESEPVAVVAAWCRMAARTGLFAGLHGVR